MVYEKRFTKGRIALGARIVSPRWFVRFDTLTHSRHLIQNEARTRQELGRDRRVEPCREDRHSGIWGNCRWFSGVSCPPQHAAEPVKYLSYPLKEEVRAF